jgi:hypothetical protein
MNICKIQKENIMKTHKENIFKRTYKTPLIKRIELDSEISLALESTPPIFPGEGLSTVPEYFDNMPFKSDFT